MYYEPRQFASDKVIVWVHDGLNDFLCAEQFCEKAQRLGNQCELYEVLDRKNTHSWYTAGMFLETREENRGLNKFFSWIEQL